jgi:protein phosphatase 2C family protein 2/3
MFVARPATDVSSRTKARIVTVTKQKINQDRGHIIYPYDSDSQTALFGTYDGHGAKGELLAEYTMNALCDKLHLHPNYQKSGKGRNIERAFHDVLTEIDDEIKNIDDLSPLNSGSTACIVLLQGKRLYVANVGDSRAVLGSRRKASSSKSRGDADSNSTIETIELTKDHNVHDMDERRRILKAGGYITIPQDEQLPARIWLDEKCSQVGLAMSRSIGDHALKHVGVIAEPVVRNYALNNNDEVSV